MNPNCPEPPPRQKIPKDGWGPRGRPECYYTSRVLDSTARYVRFVKKLRALEDEERIGLEDTTKKTNDFNFLSFFARCDRKALVNKVAHRVKLSLESYQDDLIEKRKRLSELLALEEEHNVTLFVKQCQAGADLLWQDKMERLAYLLEKRQKEREDKYSDTPLDKCVHLHPCLIAMRKRASRDVQLYQMREKQMRKEAEREFDKMWHELAMKESDALAARMEYDTIERLRRDKENHEYTQYQVEMARQKRAKEQERLKQEALLLKADVEAYFREQEEEKRKKQEEARACGEAKKEMVRERKELLAKKDDEAKLMDDTRDLIAQSLAGADREEVERRRQKERDIDECNFRMAAMKNRIAEVKNNNEEMILQEGQRRRDAVELKRCQDLKRSQKLKREISDYNKKEHEIKMSAVEEQKMAAEALEYERQVRKQLDALVEHRELTQAQAMKLHQKDLLQQIEYSKVLKERAMQEEMQERKKCEIAQREYQEAIERMLCRPFFSDRVHPFLQQMSSGLKLPETCPCGPAPGYCAESKKPPPPSKK